jgi:hypothetical protein
LAKKLRISSKDLRYLIAFFVIVTVTVSALAYVELTPPYTDQFFSMWIVGSNGLTENYFPSNNPNLIPGEQVNWTLGVYNHMSALEYVVVRVKLLNSTEISPNELTGVASPVQEIFEFARVLVSNETWTIPFPWAIVDATSVNGVVLITGLSINGTMITANLAQAAGGVDFRFVFELWFYDQTAGNLAFSWTTTTPTPTTYSVWTQLWFNATASS